MVDIRDHTVAMVTNNNFSLFDRFRDRGVIRGRSKEATSIISMLFFSILLSFTSNWPKNIKERKNSTVSSFFKVSIYTSEGQGENLGPKTLIRSPYEAHIAPLPNFQSPPFQNIFLTLDVFKTFVETTDFYRIQLF